MSEGVADNVVNPWTPTTDVLELKILGKLGEEVNELGSATCRCIIQGFGASHPVTGKTNQEWLEDEIADVFAGARLACDHYGLDEERIAERAEAKIQYLKQWHAMGCPDEKEKEA